VAGALAQSVPDIQVVVVVDDGFTRPVRLAPDPRLEVVRNPTPLGASAARNLGLKLAAGPWITFPDDDELLPEMVRVSLDAAEGSRLPGPVAVLSGVEVVDAGGQVVETRQATTVARQPPPYRQAPNEGFAQDANTLFAPHRGAARPRRLGREPPGLGDGRPADPAGPALLPPGRAPGHLPPPPPPGGAPVRPRRADARRRPAGDAQAPPLLPGPPHAARPAAGHPGRQLHPATATGGRPCGP
jgi:hypothetical protein